MLAPNESLLLKLYYKVKFVYNTKIAVMRNFDSFIIYACNLILQRNGFFMSVIHEHLSSPYFLQYVESLNMSFGENILAEVIKFLSNSPEYIG